MFYVASPWSWGTSGTGPTTSDHSGVSIHTGLTEYTGVSVRRNRGVSGYVNYMVGAILAWKLTTLNQVLGMLSVTFAA
jgi:hypothetical protein